MISSVHPQVAGPPAPERTTLHRLRGLLMPSLLAGRPWSCMEWECLKFSVYGEVSAFVHHYPGLAEAAVNSENPLLTSISRLLWGRGTQPEIFSTQTWVPAIRPGLTAVFPLKRSGTHYFGVKQAKSKGSSHQRVIRACGLGTTVNKGA